MRAGILVLFLLIAAVGLLQALDLSNGGTATPNQYAGTQVTYTLSFSGADQITLSIDGGAGMTLAKTYAVTLDGSKSHTFQVQPVICQAGWECGNQVTDWKSGQRLVASEAMWTVPAGTISTQTYTEAIPVYDLVCDDSSCSSESEVFVGWSYQTSTQQTFTPPCKPCQFTFQYAPQYRLVVQDKYGPVNGLYGWYDSCAPVQLPSPSGYSALGHSDTVDGSAGVRYVFNGWTIDSGSTANQVTMCAPHLATATYITQYLVQVTSECPSIKTKGSGWYDEGTTGTVEVDSYGPMGNWLGALGAKYVFDGWEGNPSTTSTSAQVVVNQPITIAATCRADYTMPGGIFITIAIIGAGCGYAINRKKSKGRILVDRWPAAGQPIGVGSGHGSATGYTSVGYDRDGHLIPPTTYSQPSAPPGTTGEPPSTITPGGQPTGGSGIQQGQPVQSTPSTQQGQPGNTTGASGRPVQPSRTPDTPQPQTAPQPTQGAGQVGSQPTTAGQPGQTGLRPTPSAQPTQGTQIGQAGGQSQTGAQLVKPGQPGHPVETGQPVQPSPQSQPTIKPGGNATPSIKPGVEQNQPMIGPGQQPQIGPGLQPDPLTLQPPTTVAPIPLAPQHGTEFCAHCGEKIPVKSKYCPLCGLAQS